MKAKPKNAPAVTDFGDRQFHDGGPSLPMAAFGDNIGPERPVIRGMSANDDGLGLPLAAHGGNMSPERRIIRWMSVRVMVSLGAASAEAVSYE